jgi:hypothetical protein
MEPDHIDVDFSPTRRLVKRAIRDLEDANKELARLEERCLALEARLLAEYGIERKIT